MVVEQIIINVEKKNKYMRGKIMSLKFLFLVVFAVFFALPIAHASVSLGSTMTVSNITLAPGGVKNIEVSFFNDGEDDINLQIEQVMPIYSSSSGFDIYTYVMQRDIMGLATNPYVSLPGGLTTMTPVSDPEKTWVVQGDGYVPAKKVYFSIQVPNKNTYARNVYYLLFRAMTVQAGNSSEGALTPIGQIREFPVTVYISGVSPNPDNGGSGNDDTDDATTDISFSDLGNNFVNDELSSTDDRNDNNLDLNTDGLNVLGVEDGENTENDDALKDDGGNLITGLATGNAISSGAYNLFTIILVLLGAFVLYRIWKSN